MYCLINDEGIVIQTQPHSSDNFIECPDDTVCGMYYNGSTFVTNPPVKTIDDILRLISDELQIKLNEGILWAFNQGETPHPISLSPSMRETLSTFKQLLDSGQTNPHGGYIWSNDHELRQPGGSDLSGTAIAEIAIFAGQWALTIARIAIQEKQLVTAMTSGELQSYDTSLIDWTITWNAQQHPDWLDNVVIQTP